MQLPNAKTPPRQDVASKKILIYGRSKVGKSTWAAQSDGIFLVTDPGLDEIEAYRLPAKGVFSRWEDLLEACAAVRAAEGRFKTVIIDTIDIAYHLAVDKICRDYRVPHVGDGKLAYGKGQALVRNEFYRVLLGLTQLGIGVILVSHSAEKRVEDPSGNERSVAIPALPERAGESALGLVDAILYADLDEQIDKATGRRTYSRVIRTRSTPHFHAGVRGGDTLPDSWPLSDFQGFMKAWEQSMKKSAPAQPAERK